MKKFIFLLGTLLFAAVFMSGCITDTASDDPIVGIWKNGGAFVGPDEAAFDMGVYVFASDGTGFSAVTFSGELVSNKLPITWENLGDGKYSVIMAANHGAPVPEDPPAVELKDGKLFIPYPTEGYLELTPATTADYVPGLWTGVRGDYKEYNDIQVLLYLGADGKGNTVVYGPEVMNLEDVFTAEFTWKAAEDKVVITGTNGGSFDLPLVDGKLVFAGLYPLHKYSIEDNLYGLWESAEQYVEDGVSYDIVEFLKYDGTGVEIWTVPGSDVASYKYYFTWEVTSPSTYKAVYDDGEVWLFESINNQLYDGETWYNKVGFDVLQEYAQSKVNA